MVWNDKFGDRVDEFKWSLLLAIVGVVLMMIYEIVQCIASYKSYFFKFSNWLDIALISISLPVLTFNRNIPFDAETFKQVRASVILLMAAQTVQLIAKVSVLSMSLHMAIFKRVCVTFLKIISLYLIMILAFAMSFYTMSDKDDKKK
jgi:transient receptor potential cation channel subfamily A member 1